MGKPDIIRHVGHDGPAPKTSQSGLRLIVTLLLLIASFVVIPFMIHNYTGVGCDEVMHAMQSQQLNSNSSNSMPAYAIKSAAPARVKIPAPVKTDSDDKEALKSTISRVSRIVKMQVAPATEARAASEDSDADGKDNTASGRRQITAMSAALVIVMLIFAIWM